MHWSTVHRGMKKFQMYLTVFYYNTATYSIFPFIRSFSSNFLLLADNQLFSTASLRTTR